MIKRIVLIVVMTALTAIAYYISRFWDFSLWGREGLFGIEALRPAGGLLARWLRGTDFAPFELVIWVLGIFVALTVLQWIVDKLTPAQEERHD